MRRRSKVRCHSLITVESEFDDNKGCVLTLRALYGPVAHLESSCATLYKARLICEDPHKWDLDSVAALTEGKPVLQAIIACLLCFGGVRDVEGFGEYRLQVNVLDESARRFEARRNGSWSYSW